jgi:DNA-binding winged helix-turn-helix (wHTH) protein/TolB-like protein/Tfp pilus assembly protein PilF
VGYRYEFGGFRLDPNRRRLLRDGEIVPLSSKAIETLIVLLQNPGEILDRETLMRAVWADTIVEDGNLSVAISQLRKAFGKESDPDEFIQTVPRVGYRFVAEVREVMEESTPFMVEKNGFSQPVSLEGELISKNGAEFATAPANVGSGELGSRNGAHRESKAAAPAERRSLFAPVGTGVFRWENRQTLTVISVLGLALIGLLIYSRTASRPKLPATTAEVKSMAVLPLKTLGAKPEDEYLGLGLADALINRLGRMRQIAIRPISAVQKYVEREPQDPIGAGRELGVEAVLEGSVQQHGDALRVTLRLLRVGDGVALWSGKFDEKFTDIFAMQDSISQQVAEASVLNLSREERQLLSKRQTDNVEAYRLYLKGRYFWNKRTQAGSQQSLRYFRQAIEIDPTYALAYAGLADAYAMLVWQDNRAQAEFVPKAKAAAVRALQIDETLAEAHTSLGFVKFWYDWDFVGAESEYRRAIELNPDYSTAHHWYGEFLVLTGRPEEGFRELKLAQEADPLSLIINADIGKMFFFTRQQDRAIEQLQKTLEMEPDFPVAHLFLAMAYEQKGMYENAISELQELANVPGSRTIFKAELAYIYGQSGRRTEALSILNDLEAPTTSRQPVPAYEMALVHAGLGDTKQALEWLDKAKTAHDPFLIYAQTDPNFDRVRADWPPITLTK